MPQQKLVPQWSLEVAAAAASLASVYAYAYYLLALPPRCSTLRKALQDNAMGIKLIFAPPLAPWRNHHLAPLLVLQQLHMHMHVGCWWCVPPVYAYVRTANQNTPLGTGTTSPLPLPPTISSFHLSTH